MLLSKWNSEYVVHLASMKKIGCCYVRQQNVFIDGFFFYSKIHLHQYGPFKLIKTMFTCFVRFISSIESLSKVVTRKGLPSLQ